MKTIDALKRVCDAYFLVASMDQYGNDTNALMSLVESELYGTSYSYEDIDNNAVRAFEMLKPFIKEALDEEGKEKE